METGHDFSIRASRAAACRTLAQIAPALLIVSSQRHKPQRNGQPVIRIDLTSLRVNIPNLVSVSVCPPFYAIVIFVVEPSSGLSHPQDASLCPRSFPAGREQFGTVLKSFDVRLTAFPTYQQAIEIVPIIPKLIAEHCFGKAFTA